MISENELALALRAFDAHRKDVCRVFNDHAKRRGLSVQITAPTGNKNLGAKAVAYVNRGGDDTGIIHNEQARTAVECLYQLWQDEKRQGLVLGAMQSGKTTTSLTLQWAGPALYLLTGQRTYPFYLISSQTSHADQTKIELQRFQEFYGDIEFAAARLQKPAMDAVFKSSPTLSTYRDHVLKGAIEDVHAVVSLDEIVHRRVHGRRGIRQIEGLYRRAVDGGYRPLMIIDEPQFGAGDREVAEPTGPRRAPCLLTQIFKRIEDEIGNDRRDHWFVGLSATPFELHDLTSVWRVRQYLSPAYSGYNFFGGSPISANVAVNPPTTLGLTEFARQIKVPFLAKVSMRAYDGSTLIFQRHAKKIDYAGDQSAYRADVDRALRKAVTTALQQDLVEQETPGGLCIRACNDNRKTDELIERLRLPTSKVEVIKYYGDCASGMSVKRAITRRMAPWLPYVIFVTNRARMADAFPAEVRYFIDFAHMASNLNALLQGLLGRACGYNKRSTVIMSDLNKTIIDAYIVTTGGYVHRTSPHSQVVGGFRRGAPSGMVKLQREMKDSKVRKFFSRIDKEVVERAVPPNSIRLSPPRAKGGGFRTGPVLRIAEEASLFDHLESTSVRQTLFPELPAGFHIARGADLVQHSRDKDLILGYALDQDGNCRFTFRRMDEAAVARGGAAGRAKGARDIGQHIEPTLYLEKVDTLTGEVIKKGGKGDSKGGLWRTAMVTFPLREPVRELQWSTVSFPTHLSPYDDLMTEEEQRQRDGSVA